MLTTVPTILTRVWPGLGVGKGSEEVSLPLLASVAAAAEKAVTSFILDLVPAGLFGRTGGHSALQRPDHWQLVSNGRPVH